MEEHQFLFLSDAFEWPEETHASTRLPPYMAEGHERKKLMELLGPNPERLEPHAHRDGRSNFT